MAQDPSRNWWLWSMAAAGMQGVQEEVAPQVLRLLHLETYLIGLISIW
jgi:hypothetical protein